MTPNTLHCLNALEFVSKAYDLSSSVCVAFSPTIVERIDWNNKSKRYLFIRQWLNSWSQYVIVDSGRYIYTTFLCVRLVNQLVVAFYSSACFGDKNWLQSQIAAGNYRTAPLHKIITITQTQRQVTCCEMLFSCNKLLEGPVQRALRANCKSFSFIKWNCRSGFIMGCKILGLTVNQ